MTACLGSRLMLDVQFYDTHVACPNCGRQVNITPEKTVFGSPWPGLDARIHGDCYRARLPHHHIKKEQT